jgi:catechol 2,3-dioxygenase-like lactoylglutathione lyase family enzyme
VAPATAASAAPPTAPGSGANGNANGQLGLVGMDHVGITVPDIDEAVAWFENVMGCVAPLTFGPFSGVQDLLDVDPQAVIHQITMVRCGRSANIELFDYSAPNQRTDFPKNSDWAGHHIAFYVTDIDAAVQYMVAHGAQKFFGPLPVTDGPAAGQSINYFRTPFGTYIELISYPNGMAYERDPGRPLWSPKRPGPRRSPGSKTSSAAPRRLLSGPSPVSATYSTSILPRSSSTSSTCAAATGRASSSSNTRRLVRTTHSG